MRLWCLVLPMLLLTLGSSTAAVPQQLVRPRIQLAFFHFYHDRVQVMVDGKIRFNRAVNLVPKDDRFGMAASVFLDLPTCADVVVTSRRQRIAQRLCLTAADKSIVIEGGPPLTIMAKDHIQGDD